jgi:type IV pilus assembly protein PilX
MTPVHLFHASRRMVTNHQRAQSGVALIVAMIMLVIIGLMSASLMRGSITSDLVALNARTQNQAQQYAELALRWCERQALDESNGTVSNFILAASTSGEDHWEQIGNWGLQGGTKLSKDVPDSVLASSDTPVTPSHAPECMAEYVALADTTQAVKVTARGFSPDYTPDTSGRAKSGSVVWLQSILHIGS